MKLTANIIGATGLVGKHLVRQLLNQDDFEKVRIFVRRNSGIEHPKLEENIIDFEKVEKWEGLVTGDVLFSTLGTTIKTAKTKENQYRVDFSYQYNFAKAAAKNNIPHYVLVSSSGANPKSSIFYSRMKGELDEKVKQLLFKSITILRPSVLVGERQEKRLGETIGIHIGNFVTRFIFRKHKPIKGKIVAQAMINAALINQKNPDSRIYELDKIFALATKKNQPNKFLSVSPKNLT